MEAAGAIKCTKDVDDATAASAVAPRRRGCPRPSRRCSICAFSLFLAAAGVLTLLWPHTPTWEVSKIHVEQDMLNALIGSITNPAFNGTETFELDAEVEAWNPNRIGARVGVGRFEVMHGPFILAVAETEPVVVDGRSRAVIKAHSTSKITPESSSYLMEVLPPLFTLTVATNGEVPARVWGIPVTVRAHCTVDVNVLQIMTDPDNMVTGHNCTYSVGL